MIKGARDVAPLALTEFAWGGSVSPDGRSLAFLCFTRDTAAAGKFSSKDVAISSLDGDIVRRFPTGQQGGAIRDNERVQWSGDGKAVYFGLRKDGSWNLWKQLVSGGAPVQITHFEDPLQDFDWSFDGKSLAASRDSFTGDVVMITNFR